MVDPRRGLDTRKKGPPVLEVSWREPLEIDVGTTTFSTVIHATLRGWWPEGRPNELELVVFRGGEKRVEEIIPFAGGSVSCPLTGLPPGTHWQVKATAGSHQTSRLIMVPTLPEPKSTEVRDAEKALVIQQKAQADLTTARAGKDLKELTEKPKVPAKLEVNPIGPRGAMELLIVVRDAAGTIIPECPIIIRNGDQVYTNEKIDPDGTLLWPVPVTAQEGSREVEIKAGDKEELRWRSLILGPYKADHLDWLKNPAP